MGKGKRNRRVREQQNQRPMPVGPVAEFTPRALTNSEYRAMKREFDRQGLIWDKKYSDDFAAGVLWVLHIFFGWGHTRLRRFFEAYRQVHDRLRERYEYNDDRDTCYVCKQLLLDYGIDVAKWNEEEDREMAKKRPRKLKRMEKIILTNNGIDPKGWLALDDDAMKLHVVNEATGESRRLDYPAGMKWQ